MQHYLNLIEAELKFQRRNDIKPDIVLGYMRIKYGTLDHLSQQQFRRDVLTVIAFVNDHGLDRAKEFAYHA